MQTGGGAFSAEEVRYLTALPAVVRVNGDRISYSEDFKRECMRRYFAGDSPAQIFAEAGLDSTLIGYKRIERSIARWKTIAKKGGFGRLNPNMRGRVDLEAIDANSAYVLGTGECDVPAAHANGDINPATSGIGVGGNTHLDESVYPTPYNVEMRDKIDSRRSRDHSSQDRRENMYEMLIAQQVRRIDELEHEVDRLRSKLALQQLRRYSEADASNDETPSNAQQDD